MHSWPVCISLYVDCILFYFYFTKKVSAETLEKTACFIERENYKLFVLSTVKYSIN